jgi:DNA-binding LacI/PurR family transcriptional regulator
LKSFAKATGVSVNTLKKYSDSKLEDIPTKTKNKIEKVLNG